MKITDFLGLFKKSIATIDSIENPFEDYYVVKLKFDTKVKWEAGEHGIFKLPDKTVEGKKWRAFSVASIQEEGVMMLGTRTGKTVSSYKKELISMKQGEKVAVQGPFGWFKLLDNTTPIVLIANGVGVTPIRAIVKKLENDVNRNVEIVYASNGNYLFGEDIEAIAEKNIKMNLYKTQEVGETQEKIADLAKKYGSDAYYYISGSQNAIKSIKSKLQENGVKGNRMINDPFLGY